jgi:hypothetical protein
MTTQEFPPYDARPPQTKVLIGAGTALKAGFFFAFGVTLFSLIVSVIVGIIALLVGIAQFPGLRAAFGG